MGKLIYSKGKFAFKADASSVAGTRVSETDFAEDIGCRWNADSLRWETRSLVKARRLRRYADVSAERKLKNSFFTKFAPPESIPYPDHLSPHPYQLESVWHCLTRTPAYNADEAGLGKTITSVLCMNAVPGKTLIICPPFLRYNWAKEIETWTNFGSLTLVVMESGKSLSDNKLWEADVVILPDSLLINKLAQQMIAARRWTWLFVDEAHRYKESSAQRTRALLGDPDAGDRAGIIDSSERVVFLSGTPIPNGRPIELFPLLSECAGQAIEHRDREAYGRLFCDGRQQRHFQRGHPVYTWDFSGASNLGRLRKELRSSLMVRHLKRDVLKELGPKVRKIVFLDEKDSLKPYEREVLKCFTLEQLMDDVKLGAIATYRKLLGHTKSGDAVAYISELLDDTDHKLVVFAHHIDTVMNLWEGLRRFGALKIQGGMTSKEKHQRVKLFQEQDKHRVIVGNLEAMGTGNTLTAARGVVMVEPDWRPGVNEQAEDRIHRMTQAASTYFHYLVVRNSLDERMLYRVLEKQAHIDEVLG